MEPAQTLVADPPWLFGDKLPGQTRGASRNYPCLSTDELCAFPLPPLATDCRLFMWRVASMVDEALRVCVAWGFTPKSELVWIKTRDHFALEDEGILPRATIHFGMGRQVRMSHEVCIIATRGRPPTLSRSIRSVFFAHFGGTHSRKPERFFRIVERLSPGPYVELFARRLREGWTTYGNELPGGAIHAEPSR